MFLSNPLRQSFQHLPIPQSLLMQPFLAYIVQNPHELWVKTPICRSFRVPLLCIHLAGLTLLHQPESLLQTEMCM